MRGLGRWESQQTEIQRGFLGLVAVGDEAGQQVDQEGARAAMPRVLDLAAVLELINDGFDNRPLAQEQFVGEAEQAVAHVAALFGDEVDTGTDEEVFGGLLREVAAIASRRWTVWSTLPQSEVLSPLAKQAAKQSGGIVCYHLV
jgi:hypothetical protein